jgi:hypothetical protein
LPYTYYYLAEALLGLGNYEFAYYSACQALALGREDRGLENIGTAWKVLGMISEKSGKPVYLRETGLGELIEYSTEDCFRKSAEILAEAEIGGEHARSGNGRNSNFGETTKSRERSCGRRLGRSLKN